MEEYPVGRLIEDGLGVVGEDVAQVHRPAVYKSRLQIADMLNGQHRATRASFVGAEGFD